MERRTSERLVNLVIALLTTRQFLSKSRLHDMVDGYKDLTDENFDRQFERDKDTLRGLGVPIETGTDERYFDDEPGYRIQWDDFELPPLHFDSAEVGVLVAAAQVWQQATAAETTLGALTKLWAGGTEPDTDRLAALRPHISAREPAWQPLWDALQARQRVRFAYHGLVRTVRPLLMAYRRGAWYLAAADETRDALRLFKLARLQGDVTTVGEPGAYELPDTPADDLLAGLLDAQPDAAATLDVRVGRAPWLTRRAQPLDGAPEVGGGASGGWRRWLLPYASGGDVVDDIAMGGADVIVVEPAELAAAVAAHHAALLARLGEAVER